MIKRQLEMTLTAIAYKTRQAINTRSTARISAVAVTLAAALSLAVHPVAAANGLGMPLVNACESALGVTATNGTLYLTGIGGTITTIFVVYYGYRTGWTKNSSKKKEYKSAMVSSAMWGYGMTVLMGGANIVNRIVPGTIEMCF